MRVVAVQFAPMIAIDPEVIRTAAVKAFSQVALAPFTSTEQFWPALARLTAHDRFCGRSLTA
jgi:hypothetical protein